MGDAAPASTATSTDPAKAAWANHAVLVVDDEAGMRSFLERALVNRGCTVAVAGSAEEGATHLAVRHFDLIVLDISLPGKSGLAWLHELRDSGFAGEVILITAFADMETAIDALRAGASDFILKPFASTSFSTPCNAVSSAPVWPPKTTCCAARWPTWPAVWTGWSGAPPPSRTSAH